MAHDGGMPEDTLSQSHLSTASPARPLAWTSSSHPASRMLRRIAASGLAAADVLCSAIRPGLWREPANLTVLALHSLCPTRAQIDDPALAPSQNVCVEDFRALVAAVLESDYRIVAPAQVDAGLAPDGKYVMLTFDDGYFNNVLALDVLDEFDVPAAFFISTNHVLQQKAFWWDALSRELVRSGASRPARHAAMRQLKAMPAAQIEAWFQRHFGSAALRPHSDRDRPFTRAELADFSRHRHVHLGNHTADHAILTRCTREQMAAQIRDCQGALADMTGTAPIAIAYPNGNHSPEVIAAAMAAGLRIGVTVRPAQNRVPQPGAPGSMRLARFYFHGGADARREFRTYRCGFVPSRLVSAALHAA